MTIQPLTSRTLRDDPPPAHTPKIPTIVLTAWKGGVWKTSLAVSLAERLAFAGLRVGLLATDAQQDARARLGIRPRDPDVARVDRGDGVVVAIGLGGPQAADVLYRHPERIGPIDLAVVDTAPSRRGMRLPGTLVIVPVFDADSTRNNVAALLAAPENCELIVVRTGAKMARKTWEREVGVIGEALGRPLRYVPHSLSPSSAIAGAHAQGRSVWSLARRGAVKGYLDGIELLAEAAWSHAGEMGEMPDAPSSGAVETFIPGWDDDDDED